MLSEIINDGRFIKAANQTVRVIIRRPHAYKVKAKYPDTPIPGLVVLDAEGKFLGAVALPSKDAGRALTELLCR